jgi:hypothetical protein
MPTIVYDPETGEVDWKKSDRAYPEHAVHYLIRGREERLAREAEVRAKKNEAKREQ